MTMINRATFQPSTDKEHFNGTVEVTLHGETRRVTAHLNRYNMLTAYDLIGTYQSGGKQWAASITQMENGMESVNFGRDDRSGRFHKRNNVWFR